MSDFFNGDQVCLREMQAFHEMLDREKGFDRDMLRNVAYLAEEVGEVVSAIREVRDADGPSAGEASRVHLGEELADCLAYLLKLANYGGLDLQEAYVKKMNRNLNRAWLKKPVQIE
jgi:NTP pyrophosphatase (non-canonical NTP hydrolase)